MCISRDRPPLFGLSLHLIHCSSAMKMLSNFVGAHLSILGTVPGGQESYLGIPCPYLCGQ